MSVNKVAIITGAGRGIGKATALKFAEQGTHLAVLSRTKSELNEVFALSSKYSVRTLPFICDVGDETMVKKMVSKVTDEFGRIDYLINNAGIRIDCDVIVMSLNVWNTIIRTNLTGTFLCSKYVLPIMVKQKKGVILNISSILGKKGFQGASAYSASKFGVVGFTETLAEEVKKYNIRVNAVCPGSVDTNMIKSVKSKMPKKRLIKPTEVADLLLFLCSDSAKAITGQSINIF